MLVLALASGVIRSPALGPNHSSILLLMAGFVALRIWSKAPNSSEPLPGVADTLVPVRVLVADLVLVTCSFALLLATASSALLLVRSMAISAARSAALL